MEQDLLLMTPGPVALAHDVLQAGARPLLHHRTRDFAPIYQDCVDRLKRLFKTSGRLFLTHSSGTGVMETAMVNHFLPGDKVLTVETGAFGERFTQIAKALRLEPVPLAYPWGHRARVEDIITQIRKHPDLRGVTVTFNETSTGVHNDLAAIGKALHAERPELLFITDGVSGIGALPFEMDAWHVDVALSASQKGFLAPPGVGIIALSDKAWQRVQAVDCHGYYFDLKHYEKNQALEIPSYPWTPAITATTSLQVALEAIERQGLDCMIAHYARLATGLREALSAMGLGIFTQPDARSNVLTVIDTPKGIHPKQIVQPLRQRYHVLIAGGQGQIADRVFRIATIGAIGERELVATVGLLEVVLAELKVIDRPGAGTTALLRSLMGAA